MGKLTTEDIQQWSDFLSSISLIFQNLDLHVSL